MLSRNQLFYLETKGSSSEAKVKVLEYIVRPDYLIP